jgi:hypothetical protein
VLNVFFDPGDARLARALLVKPNPEFRRRRVIFSNHFRNSDGDRKDVIFIRD